MKENLTLSLPKVRALGKEPNKSQARTADFEWWRKFIVEQPYAYHGTHADVTSLDPGGSANGYGYLAPSPNHVYLTTDPDEAAWHADNHDDPAILRIDLSQLDPSLVEADEDFAANHAELYGMIPPIDPYDLGETYDGWDGPSRYYFLNSHYSLTKGRSSERLKGNTPLNLN